MPNRSTKFTEQKTYRVRVRRVREETLIVPAFSKADARERALDDAEDGEKVVVVEVTPDGK